MSSMSREKSRCLNLAGCHRLPIEAPPWAAPRALLGIFTTSLIAATLAACSESGPLPIEKPASVEPARHIANLTNKGSRLDIKPVAVVAEDPEPAVTSEPAVETKAATDQRKTLHGLASYYWQGTKTASGERFNERDMTAAHRTLPFGTRVRVTSLETGRSITVRINDRGPYVNGRIVDISRAAAESIGMIDRGVTKVKLDVVQ
jgi:rare lipoprotein A